MSKPGQPFAEIASAPASGDDAAATRRGAMDPTHEHLRRVADALIAATNAFAVEQVLGLRLNQAVIGEMSSAKALNQAAQDIKDIFEKNKRRTGLGPPLPE